MGVLTLTKRTICLRLCGWGSVVEALVYMPYCITFNITDSPMISLKTT
jgi:hypothetical protein